MVSNGTPHSKSSGYCFGQQKFHFRIRHKYAGQIGLAHLITGLGVAGSIVASAIRTSYKGAAHSGYIEVSCKARVFKGRQRVNEKASAYKVVAPALYQILVQRVGIRR